MLLFQYRGLLYILCHSSIFVLVIRWGFPVLLFGICHIVQSSSPPTVQNWENERTTSVARTYQPTSLFASKPLLSVSLSRTTYLFPYLGNRGKRRSNSRMGKVNR